ncbi:MAG: toxin-activating lysine-acyltransferase [Hyphomicrobiales bacterium]
MSAIGNHTKAVPDVPTSDEFTKTVGLVTWLMSMSEPYCDMPISSFEKKVFAPLMLKQVRVFYKRKQPVAVLIWAYASKEVQSKLNAGGYEMRIADWRSGPEVVVVDCISPFADQDIVVESFMAEVAAAEAATSNR